jgi:hypothetical protein
LLVVLAEGWAAPVRWVGWGWAPRGGADTPGLEESLARFHKLTKPILRDLDQGADTAIWLAATDAAKSASGALWHDRATRPKHYVPWTRETPQERDELWRAVESLTQ